MEKIIQKAKNNKIFLIMFLLVYVVYFSFGVLHLTEFVTVDEHFWINKRIPQYWKAIFEGDWEKTRIHEKPGVTVALISGAGLLFEKNPEKFTISDKNKSDPSREKNYLRLNLIFRLPILIFNGLFSLYLFYVLKKLFNDKWLALFSLALTILSPILLGISQIVNADSLMWIFSIAAIFSFAALLQSKEKKFLFLSPFFLAASLLCKFSATILYPFFFLILLSYFFIEKNKNEKIDLERLKLGLVGYALSIFGSLLFFAIFMPAVFLKIKYLFKGTIDYPGMRAILIPIAVVWLVMFLDIKFNGGKIINWIYESIYGLKKNISLGLYGILTVIAVILIINANTGWDFLRINNFPFDARQEDSFVAGTTFLQKIFLEFRQLVFSLQPVVLVGIFWLWIRAAFRKTKFQFLIFIFSVFILVYYLAVIEQNLMANIRYSIVLYPIAATLGAIGIYDFFSSIKRKISPIFISLGLIIVCVFHLWVTKPFFFNYTNSLLPKKYIITGAWGYGGYEAAKYINSQENPENLRIWADYEGTCEFIKGFCMVKNFKADLKKNNFDYYVLTRRGQILDENKNGKGREFKNKPVWTLNINNRPENFIRIFPKEN